MAYASIVYRPIDDFPYVGPRIPNKGPEEYLLLYCSRAGRHRR